LIASTGLGQAVYRDSFKIQKQADYDSTYDQVLF